MNLLRRRINPETFVITRRQLAKYLKTNPSRVWRWEKWKHVLWVHVEGIGGYFISYRQLEQWVAACCTLLRSCQDLKALKLVWSAIKREAERYTQKKELHDSLSFTNNDWRNCLVTQQDEAIALRAPTKLIAPSEEIIKGDRAANGTGVPTNFKY